MSMSVDRSSRPAHVDRWRLLKVQVLWEAAFLLAPLDVIQASMSRVAVLIVARWTMAARRPPSNEAQCLCFLACQITPKTSQFVMDLVQVLAFLKCTATLQVEVIAEAHPFDPIQELLRRFERWVQTTTMFVPRDDGDRRLTLMYGGLGGAARIRLSEAWKLVETLLQADGFGVRLPILAIYRLGHFNLIIRRAGIT